MVGNLVAGKRIAQASGRDLGQIEDNDLVKKVNQCLWQLENGKEFPLLGAEQQGEALKEKLVLNSCLSLPAPVPDRSVAVESSSNS